jgi:hypothetical protein
MKVQMCKKLLFCSMFMLFVAPASFVHAQESDKLLSPDKNYSVEIAAFILSLRLYQL